MMGCCCSTDSNVLTESWTVNLSPDRAQFTLKQKDVWLRIIPGCAEATVHTHNDNHWEVRGQKCFHFTETRENTEDSPELSLAYKVSVGSTLQSRQFTIEVAYTFSPSASDELRCTVRRSVTDLKCYGLYNCVRCVVQPALRSALQQENVNMKTLMDQIN
eukprot:m.314878 g.314878  ORF g.314878 m.314878 type:complete len:160 (+) comp20274_c0_seq11:81-560(+)